MTRDVVGDVVGDVVVGAGLRHELGRRAAAAVPSAHRWAVCIDAAVERHHGAAFREAMRHAGSAAGRPEPTWHVVPSGEHHKTRETWARLTDALLESGHGRDSAICAIGGGVTGDLAGFVAATYLRGIPVVQVPTTLLAMVDASVGGKTGVDVPAGKNLVGAFHPAALVLADPEVLGTLPREERRAGFAEMLKHGAVADAAHFHALVEVAPRLAADDTPEATVAETLAGTIAASVRIKSAIVAADPAERGRRAILNFGHTVAHAIEHATRYAVRHGEAVAIGMVLEARVGEALGVTAPGTAGVLERAVRSAGLPTAVPPPLGPDAILAAMRHDKKGRVGIIRCALPAEIGRMARDGDAWTIPVPEAEWRVALGG